MRAAFAFLLATLSALCFAEGYQIHPFTSGRLIHADNGRLRYFFELPKGVDVPQNGSFQVSYDTSSALAKMQTSMSVLLNGQPVGSRDLGLTSEAAARWTMSLPKDFFKEGFNEIVVATRSRSTDGPCREDDDLRHWIRILPTSELVVNLAIPSSYPLASYPFPYVNWLSQTATSAPIVLGASPSPDVISAALNLAAGMGMRLPGKPLSVVLTHASNASSAIHFGSSEASLPGAENALAARSHSLWITGKSSTLLDAAVRAISDSQLSAQMLGVSASSLRVVPTAQTPETRVGTATFEELGYPSISLAGVGTQRTTIVLRRPLSAQLGRGGALRLRFRHAATLSPARSLLSVTMNDQPIGNVALSPDNANDGELVCPIPVDLADRDEWNIQIVAHNELANVDCAKTYEDVAWTTILGVSDFELREGSLPYNPYLEGFPYLRNRDGKLPDSLTVNLGLNPSDQELTMAATAVAIAAQSNRATTDWRAIAGAISGNDDLVIGLFSDEKRFKAIASTLWIAPGVGGHLTVKKIVPLLPSLLVDSVVVQAVSKANGGVSYVILGASNQALARFTDYIASLKGAGSLRGQVAVFSKEGQLFNFDLSTVNQRRAAEAAELRRYKPAMNLVMIGIIVVLVLLAVYIGRKFVKRKLPKS